MSPQRSPGSHLYPSNWLHAASGLGQTRITSSLPALPDGVLEVLGLLAQLLEFVHGAVCLLLRRRCRLARCAEDALLSHPHSSRCLNLLPHQSGLSSRHSASSYDTSSVMQSKHGMTSLSMFSLSSCPHSTPHSSHWPGRLQDDSLFTEPQLPPLSLLSRSRVAMDTDPANITAHHTRMIIARAENWCDSAVECPMLDK